MLLLEYKEQIEKLNPEDQIRFIKDLMKKYTFKDTDEDWVYGDVVYFKDILTLNEKDSRCHCEESEKKLCKLWDEKLQVTCNSWELEDEWDYANVMLEEK